MGNRGLRGFLVALASGMVLVGSAGTARSEVAKVWETEGFKNPESVRYDPARDVLYVSNVNGSPVEKDGNGYISKLAPDGRVIEDRWVSGLDAPKGMAVLGDRLYVSDIDQLVEIDIGAGRVAGRYPAPGAKFLNDVTADAAGRVYVSDMMDDAIYRLEGGTFSLWLKNEALTSPNGLVAEAERLLVAAWGVRTEGFATKTPGQLKTVSYGSRAVASLGEGAPVGNLDGLEPDGSGRYLATDWMSGALFRIDPSGQAELLLDLNQGSADLGYIAPRKLAVIPMMNDGKVTAYRVD
ncbi:MAG: SMP-30/gluconolactonase/LRE family protein [Kiloniellaceae bacterium]